MIVSPCNGLARCWRHPTGCARIVLTSREEWDARQRYKTRRLRLWHVVREHYRIGAKWGLDPIPSRYHLAAVLLMEQVLQERELLERLQKQGKLGYTPVPTDKSA
ncbi:MAG: hypothetical protein Q8R35_04015 [bacterium]|nr:hypothetical protein [bacterium]